MTTTVPRPRPTPSRPSPAGPGGGLLGALDDRRRALAGVGPNWFATVMGTSIVATAAVDLPVQVPGQRVFAQVVWVLAGLLLTAVGAATVGHWVRFPDRARRLAADPVMAHFYGAVPMALLAFGAATLAVGVDLIGAGAAVGIDWVLWLLGTALGLIYGLPVWGFAMMWAALAIAITVRTARRGLPFSLTWWSFTFPVGTVVTGTSALAITTGTDLFRVAAAVFFIGLLAAWITVAARTTYGTWTGELLR
jgi:tellurite resistance protein TehA-like permease